MKNCLFCNMANIQRDILWETEHFFVKVGIGILAPGHVMIISKKHILCFGELPQKLDKEFLLLKEDVFNKVRSNFSQPVLYEHGFYNQSVQHAHIHFVPSKSAYCNLENLKEKIFKELKSTQIEDIFEVRDVYRKEGSYVYLEEDGTKWIFHTSGIPEKFTFRKEFARITGLSGLIDWRNIPQEEKSRNEEWIRLTKEKLNLTTGSLLC